MHKKLTWAPPKSVDLWLLFAMIFFFYLLLFKLPFYPFYSDGDQLIFLYNADRMMHGERMYADFFQFTFPGGQVLYFLLFTIFGTKFWLLPFAILLMGAATFWSLLRVSKLTIPHPYCYLPPVLLIFFGARWWGLDGSHRTFSSLFVLLAILVLLKGQSLGRLAAAGGLCALASYFTQQRGFVALAAIAVFIFIDNCYRGWKWPRAIAELGVLSSAFLFLLAALCSYFIVTSGLEVFIYDTLVYPALYYRFHEQNNYGAFLIYLQQAFDQTGPGWAFAIIPSLFYAFGVPLSAIVFAVVFWRERKFHNWDYWRAPVLIALVAGFSIAATTNPNYSRYYLLSAPSLVLLAWLLARFDLFGKHKHRVVTGLTAALLLFGAFQCYRIQTNWDYLEIDAPRGKVYALNTDQMHVYPWLLEHTEPREPVFEVYDPFIYFLLDLRNPARIGQLFPSDLTRPEFVTGTVEDLKRDPPRYILWNNSYTKPDTEREPGDHIGPLADYLQAEYAPASPVYKSGETSVQIWERKPAAINTQ